MEAAAKELEGFRGLKPGKGSKALAGKGQAEGQAATLEQQRLTARLGGSCREGIGGF